MVHDENHCEIKEQQGEGKVRRFHRTRGIPAEKLRSSSQEASPQTLPLKPAWLERGKERGGTSQLRSVLTINSLRTGI